MVWLLVAYTFIRHFVKRRSQKLLRCLTLPDYPGVGALAVDWLGASWLQSTGSLLTLTIDRQGCCPGWIFWDLLGWLHLSFLVKIKFLSWPILPHIAIEALILTFQIHTYFYILVATSTFK